MLIPSERHTAKDLALWAELEAADRVHAARIDDKTTHALATIEAFLRDGGDAQCSVSWGKDSVALAHMVWRVCPDVPLVNIYATPSRNPGCDAVRDAFLAEYPMSLHEEPADYSETYHAQGTPAHERETDRVFFGALRRVKQQFGPRYFSGIRADESGLRAMRFAKYGETSLNTCAPLSRWTAQDVMAYLALHDLPVHPNYAMLGGGRWPREHIRTDDIGDWNGRRMGRAEWEKEYYGDVLNRIAALEPPPICDN